MKIVITAFVALVLAIPGALGAEKVFWGASGAAWEVDGNWSDGMVPTAADDVRIPAGVIVTVVSTATAKSLTLESGAAVSVFGKTPDFTVKESASDLTSAGRYAADSTSTEAIGLSLAGNLTLKGSAWLAVGGFLQQCPAALSVGGNLTLSDTARLAVYPGPSTFANRMIGAELKVTGTLELAGSSKLYLPGDPGNKDVAGSGASVLVTADAFVLGEDASVIADSGCGIKTTKTDDIPSQQANHRVGASYGGRGGKTEDKSYNACYGSIFAPILPGRQGSNYANDISLGGGVVRVRARQMTLNGTVDASSVRMWTASEASGGAGGAIFLAAEQMTCGGKMRLLAKGQNSTVHPSNATISTGGGGGGRIALAMGFASKDLDELEAGTYDTTALKTVALDTVYPGVSAAGGLGAYSGGAGEAGTAVLYAKPSATQGLALVETRGVVAVDGSVTVTPASVTRLLNAAGTSRQAVAGYSVDGVAGEGTSCEVSAAAGAETAVAWTYGPVEHLLSVEKTSGGTVSSEAVWVAEGEEMSVTATPEDGRAFVAWLVDFPCERAALTNAVLTLTMDRPHRIVAVFDDTAALAPKSFSGTDGAKWEDPASWTPAGVPTIGDAVTIPTGKKVAADGLVVAGSLTLEANAVLSQFGAKIDPFAQTLSLNSAFKDGRHALDTELSTETLGILVARDFVFAAGAQAAVGGYGQLGVSSVAVGGDFTLAASAKFGVYPGPASTHAAQILGGGRVFVAGTTTIAGELHCYIHEGGRYLGTGAGVVLDFDAATVSEGGLVAAYVGACYKVSGSLVGGAASARQAGVGHGGKGGAGSSGGALSGGGAAFGCNFAPIEVTKPSANASAVPFGAGSVHLKARTLTIDGTVTASPNPAGYNLKTETGGAAGGSVWIIAQEFAMGQSGRLTARGTDGGTHPSSTSQKCGGGGGGRIAVGINLTEEMIATLEAEAYPKDLDPASDLSVAYPGQVDVAGGKGIYEGEDGGTGTALLYQVRAAGIVALEVSTVPADVGATLSPAPGSYEYAIGATPEVTVTDTVLYLDDEHRIRRRYAGYVLTIGTETVAGTETAFALPELTANAQLVFKYDIVEQKTDAVAAGNGSVDVAEGWSSAGGTQTLTATPAPGARFVRWMTDGVLSEAEATAATLALPTDVPRHAVAVFSGATESLTTKTFVGEDGGAWETAKNWTPAGMPTIADAVTVPADKTVVVRNWAVAGSLTLGDGAVMSVAGATAELFKSVYHVDGFKDGRNVTSAAFSGGVGVAVAGDVTLGEGAQLALGGYNLTVRTALSVGGDFELGERSTFAVYAGPAKSDVEYRQGGGRVSVGGAMTLLEGATNVVYGHIGKGVSGTAATVVLAAKTVDVRAGAAIRSWAGSDSNVPQALYAGRASEPAYGGSGHAVAGGSGGFADNPLTKPGGGTYDFAYAPRWPGRESRTGEYNEPGAGALRIEAGCLRLAGTLDVTPIDYSYKTETGGAAGGSVWILADSFVASGSAKILAKGLDGGIHTTTRHQCGGGSGGLVSVCLRLTAAEKDELWTSGTVSNPLIKVSDLVAAPPARYAKLGIDVTSGVNRIGVTGETYGEVLGDGTAYLIQRPIGFTVLIR